MLQTSTPAANWTSSFAAEFKKLEPDFGPRHIEAYVRCEHSTLGRLSASMLRREARLAADCVRVGGIQAAEDCARSFGL